MAPAAFPPLPPYPAPTTWASLPPSSRAKMKQNMASTLSALLAQSARMQSPSSSTLTFVSSFLAQTARETLDSLVWSEAKESRKEDSVDRQIRTLALRLCAQSSVLSSLSQNALLSLCVAFPSHASRMLSSSDNALTSSGAPQQLSEAFSALLSSFSARGLHTARKTARTVLCVTSSLRAASLPALYLDSDARLVKAMSAAYEDGMQALARAYGIAHLHAAISGDVEDDEWVRLWLATKVDIIDTLHVFLTSISSPNSPFSKDEAARHLFQSLSALLVSLTSMLPSNSESTSSPVPFSNRPLLMDYMHAYPLPSLTVSSDPQIKLLEWQLHELTSGTASSGRGEPGALKLLLRSSGAPMNIDLQRRSKGKGKAVDEDSTPVAVENVDDTEVEQILSILPAASPAAIRSLLRRFAGQEGKIERVMEALFEDPDRIHDGDEAQDVGDELVERRNIWDGEEIDVRRVRKGKMRLETTSDPDAQETAELKAATLRRAAAIEEEEAEEIYDPSTEDGYRKDGGRDLAYEDEDEDLNTDAINVHDGSENSDPSDDDNEDGPAGGVSEADTGDGRKPNAERIMELAYMDSPDVFGRDAATRRSPARKTLKERSGWTDEQIEGWKIMLERDPRRKERLLQKYEFTGNRSLQDSPSTSTPQNRGNGRGRGRGRGRGDGRGHGRGGGRGQGNPGQPSGDREHRDRARKEKRGNQARKRGHDHKMARGGGPG